MQKAFEQFRKQDLAKYLSIALIVVIVLLSIRSFAIVRVRMFDSDNAIHVLMAYHLKLPEDLYYWGQDRLGSLVPILSHWLLKILPLPVATIVSIVQYALLILGYLAFASLLRQWTSRFAFALVWFLPIAPLTELVSVGPPFAVQLGLIAAACVAFDRCRHCTPIGQRVWLAIATACLFLSLWVSDFTIVPMFLLSLWGLWQLVHTWRSQRRFAGWEVLTVLLVSGCGIAFIRFAKAHAYARPEYRAFASIDQSIEMTQKLLTSLGNTLTFQAKNSFMTLHALLAVGLLAYLVWAVLRQPQVLRSMSGWFYLFLGTALLGTPLLLISKWVYLNEVNLRYFTVTYVALWLAVLFVVEALPSANALAKRAIVLMLLAAIASSLSLPSYVYSIEQPRAKFAQLQPLKTLGNAGLIGNYWTSYLLCVVDPANLNCSRFDPQGEAPCPPPSAPPKPIGRVRCMRCVPEVFASDTIYLVKDRWFDRPPFKGDFPADIQQFGQCLVKAGQPRKVAGYTIAPYRLRSAGERSDSSSVAIEPLGR